MAQQAKQDPEQHTPPSGDPWHAFGVLVAGVAFYGLLGWVADRWFGTSFLVGIGVLIGAVLGVYMTWSRFKIAPDPHDPGTENKTVTTQELP